MQVQIKSSPSKTTPEIYPKTAPRLHPPQEIKDTLNPPWFVVSR